MEKIDYLIIGGGVAGTTAAETLRRLRPASRVTILSRENHPLYSRVLLPHVVKGKVPRERSFLRSLARYEEQGIEFFHGTEARLLNAGQRIVTASDGREFHYGKLLLAAGGEALPPLVPGSSLPGVTPFRTLEDADHIVASLGALETGGPRTAAVLGSSFISLEFPPFFEKYGWRSVVLLRGSGYFWRFLGEEASGMITEVLRAHGVEVLAGVEFIGCQGDRALEALHLRDGRRIDASFLGYGLGISGEPPFLGGTGIKAGDHGIEADAFLKTNAPDVWTAGDCAFFEDRTVGRSHRLGNWLNAQEQGRYAGMAMAGEIEEPFSLVSSYATQIFELSIAFVGDLRGNEESSWLTRGSAADKKIGRLHLRGGRLVGAALLNVTSERGTLTMLIKSAIDLTGREKELANPAFDLKQLL